MDQTHTIKNGAVQSAAYNPASKQDYTVNNSKNPTGNRVLMHALELQSKGFSVIPVHYVRDDKNCSCGNKKCSGVGKHPIGKWTEFQSRCKSPEEIIADWSRYPQANLGIVTGKISGCFVLDIDGDEGEESIRKLESEYSPLPESYEVITGGGGRHIYFKFSDDMSFAGNASQIAPYVDIRAEGNMTVCPPSKHLSGREYVESCDSIDEIVDTPEWLIQLITKKVNSSASSTPSQNNALNIAAWKDQIYGAPEGKRNASMASMAGKLFYSGLTYEDVYTMCHALNQNSKPPLDETEVAQTIDSIFKKHQRGLQEKEGDIEITCFDDVEVKPVNWLWPDRIAGGKITILAGNPGLGKSQITASLASIITSGGIWPCGASFDKIGHVLFLSAEDDPADTIKPRLMATGADVKKCHILQAVSENAPSGNKKARQFNLKKDVERLEKTLEKIGDVKMVVIDPISAYLGETDSHKDSDIRSTLAPLSEMAMKHDAAIILVTHFNKSKEQEMIGRIIGSIGIIAAARAGYAIIKDETDAKKRLFIPVKNNIGNDSDGFSFCIEGHEVQEGIHSSKVVWNDEVINVQDVLNPEKKTQINGAGEFLVNALSDGARKSSDIIEEATEAMGYSKSAIQRAANRLGITRKKNGMKGGWLWSLPLQEDTEDTKDVKSSERDHSLLLLEYHPKIVKSSKPSESSEKGASNE